MSRRGASGLRGPSKPARLGVAAVVRYVGIAAFGVVAVSMFVDRAHSPASDLIAGTDTTSSAAPRIEVSDGDVVPPGYDAVLPSGDVYRFVWGRSTSSSLVIEYAIEPAPTDGAVTVHAARDVAVVVDGREFASSPVDATDRRIPGDGIAGFSAAFDLPDSDDVDGGDTVDVLMTTADGTRLTFEETEVKDDSVRHGSVTGL